MKLKELIDKLSDYQLFGFKTTQKIINFLIKNSLIKKKQISGKIIDFGCGVGGSSIFFHINGGKVISIDINKIALKELKNVQIIPNIIEIDGIDFLKKYKFKDIDIIFSSYLTPDNESFIEEFFILSKNIIKNDGKIIVYSDNQTIYKLIKILKKLKFEFILKDLDSTKILII